MSNLRTALSITCRICGRQLKNKTSMELGMGSVCRKKRGADKASPYEMFGAEKAEAIKSFNSDIILSRDSQGAHANVPHRIVRHSPDGFEWGYSGSGPSDLALNILSIYIGQAAAERGGLYQDFKDRFISPMPEQGGVIRREDILNWLKLKGEN